MEKVTIQFDADLSPLQEKLGQLKSSGLQELSSGATQASSSIEKLSQSAKNMPMDIVAQGFDEATASIKENSQAITENVGKQQSMKAELKELKNQLQILEDQGKDNTKEFEQMAIRAGKLSDQIGDTSARIKALGDDSKYIKAVSQAIGAMASAYSIAQGASALFGSENKDVEKALLKVNAAMSIANGLQQINEILQKQSTVAVVAHSTAQKLYNYFVVEGTVATSAFRIALGATGIGLAVIALVSLYQAYEEHNKQVKDAEEKTKSYGDALKSAFTSASQEITSLQLLYQTATDTTKSMNERKKAVDEMQKIYPSYFANLTDEAILNGKAKKSYDDLNGAILDNARAKAYTQILNEQVSKQEIELEQYRKQVRDAQKENAIADQNMKNMNNDEGTLQAQGQYSANQLIIQQNQKKINDLVAQNQNANKDLLDNILLYTNKASQYQSDISGATTQKIKDDADKAKQAVLDFYQIKINQSKISLDATEKGSQAELEAQIALQYATTQLSIKQVELSTDSEELKKSKIETINANMYAQLKQIMATYDKAQEDSANKMISNAKKNSDEYYQIKINTAKQILNATEKGSKEELDAQISYNYATAQLAIKHIEDSTDSEQIKKSKIETIMSDMYGTFKTLMENYDKSEEDSQKAKIDKAKKTAAELKKIDEETKKQAIASSIESLQTIANAEFEVAKNKRDAQLQADIDALEKRKEKELSNKNLTQSQIDAINKKYAKLEAEEKKKAWEADKQAKKEQAIINGALAITNILATYAGTNPVLAGILTAASIISTATQVRVIDSQPVPKFAKGKNLDGYEGMAIIGEAGRELRLDSDGSMKMYNHATLDHVNADSIILPNNLTEALLKTNIPAINLRNMNAVTKQNISAKLDIDYKKLARTLGEELKNSQKVSVNIDEKGFETRIMNGISERRVIDNRYKL